MQTGSVLEETCLTFSRMMVAKQATNCIFYYLFIEMDTTKQFCC